MNLSHQKANERGKCKSIMIANGNATAMTRMRGNPEQRKAQRREIIAWLDICKCMPHYFHVSFQRRQQSLHRLFGKQECKLNQCVGHISGAFASSTLVHI